MSDLNIDQLQKELVDAENYLKTDVFHGAESGDQEINVRASQALRDSIDSAKKANILQQLGRQPLSSSVRLSHDSTSQVGVSTSTASAAADKENKSSPTSSSKYTDPSERERLINRLLMEHSARKSDSSMSTSMTRNYFSDIEPISKNQLSGRENEASSLKFSELAQTPAKDEVFQFPTPSSYDPGDDENDQESASHTNAESASVGNDSMLFFASDLPSTTFPSNRLDYQDNSSPRLRKEHESDPVDESPQAAYDPQLEFMETIRFTKPLDGFHGDSFVGRSDYSQQQKNRRNFLYDNNEDAEQGKDENFTSIGPAKLDESNSPNHSTAIGESSFAEKRHLKTKEMLLEEAEKEFRDSCKFSPTLFTKIYGRKYSRDGSPNRSYVDSRSREAELKHYMRAKSASPSRGRRLERSLSTSPSRSKSRQRYSEEQILFRIEEMNRIHENRLKERHVMKKEYEQLEMLNCTFKPNLSKGTESIVRQKALLETVPGILRGSRDEKSSYDVGESSASRSIEVSERLYKLAGVRASQQKWLEKEIQEARLSEYSFHPTINPITATKALENNYRPIHERVYELQRDKKRYLMGLKAAIDEEDKANFTFTPQIDARSKVMAEKKNNASYAFYANMDESVRREDLKPFQKDVGTRLMNEGQLIMKRKQQLLEEREKIIAEQMEKPFLSDGSRKLAEKNDLLRYS